LHARHSPRLERIVKNTRLLREARMSSLDAAIRVARRRAAGIGPRVSNAFHQLLVVVRARTGILSPRVVSTEHARRFVEVLFAFALHRCEWKRPLFEWTEAKSTTSNVIALATLAEHLFAPFPVPRFMNSAWLGTPQEQRWYIRLGAGDSVRAIDFPVPLNRWQAHVFRLAPDDLTILGALRWAQARGLGASPELARAVAKSRLGREIGDEAFHRDVIALAVELGNVDVVELFHDPRHPPPSPVDVALCSLGPKTRQLILQECGVRPAPRPRPQGLTWRAAPFAGFRWNHFDPLDARRRIWRIAELRSAEELRLEGIAMRHCVASYAPKCAFGGSSIWSMTVEVDGYPLRRAVTIEVNVNSRKVCQVKAIANQKPKPRFMDVLRRWATEQGLQMRS
jgi:hypothetical protein